LTPLEILEKCNYLIKYFYNEGDNHAILHILLDKQKIYKFTYENGEFKTNYQDITIKCPKYASLAYLSFFIQEICKEEEYPAFRIKKLFNNNPSNLIRFLDVSEEETLQSMYLQDLLEEYSRYGLRKNIIEKATMVEITDGLYPLVGHHLGITIS
jgi:hypothetical protein